MSWHVDLWFPGFWTIKDGLEVFAVNMLLLLIAVFVWQVDWMLSTELFIDLFFLCDIVLNFNTGFIADQVSHSGKCGSKGSVTDGQSHQAR